MAILGLYVSGFAGLYHSRVTDLVRGDREMAKFLRSFWDSKLFLTGFADVLFGLVWLNKF